MFNYWEIFFQALIFIGIIFIVFGLAVVLEFLEERNRKKGKSWISKKSR